MSKKQIIALTIFIPLMALVILGAKFYSIYQNYQSLKEFVSESKEINLPLVFDRVNRFERSLSGVSFLINLHPQGKEALVLLDKVKRAQEPILDLTGYKGERTYLVVMQNNTELRPSGGFWGAYGILKIKDAKIVSFETGDSYNVDKDLIGKYSPPVEAAEIIDDQWRFWNANWSPDFEISVKNGIFFFNQVKPEIKFDGAFGPNVDFLLKLLSLSGPIEIPNHNFSVDQNNFVKKMIYEPVDPAVYNDRKGDPNFITSSSEKKPMLATLAQDIVEKILQNGKAKELLEFTYQALQNKDLILWSSDPQMEKFIESHNYAGKMPQNGNYLAVIDANLGSKLDFLIDKKLDIIKIDSKTVKVIINYKNTLDPEKDRKNQAFITYRNLFRIFIPKDTQMVEFSGGQQVMQLQNDSLSQNQFFYSLMVLEPQEETEISFTLKYADEGEINLFKQAGNHQKINHANPTNK